MRPAAVIERLRDECDSFERRVAGVIGRTDAFDLVMGEGRGLSVPCAYVVWEGDAVGNEQVLDGLSDTVETTFSVFVVVSGSADSSGQDACERLLDARDELMAALVGWAPAGGQYGAFVYDGAPDPPIYNRAYGACTFLFTAQYFTNAP